MPIKIRKTDMDNKYEIIIDWRFNFGTLLNKNNNKWQISVFNKYIHCR